MPVRETLIGLLKVVALLSAIGLEVAVALHALTIANYLAAALEVLFAAWFVIDHCCGDTIPITDPADDAPPTTSTEERRTM